MEANLRRDTNTDILMHGLRSLVLLVGIVLLFVAFFLSIMRVDMFLKNSALKDCGNLTRYEATQNNGNLKVSYPIIDQYEKCVKRVGFK